MSVAVLAPSNIAVSILGSARAVKDEMEITEYLAIVEIDIEEVKNDMIQHGIIMSAIAFIPPDDLKSYYLGVIAEIENM
jgi:hypothetical protein